MVGARAAAWNGGGGAGDKKGGGRRALTLALVIGLVALLVEPAEGRSLRSPNKKNKKADADPAPTDQRQGKCLGMGACVYVMPRTGTCRGRAVGERA